MTDLSQLVQQADEALSDLAAATVGVHPVDAGDALVAEKQIAELGGANQNLEHAV